MASGQGICRVLKLDAAEAMHLTEVAEPSQRHKGDCKEQ